MPVKNGSLPLSGGTMDYIRFGSGPRQMILLPGLGDGLRTVKGTALPMAMLYRSFGSTHTVWAFSRREPLGADADTRTMARDVALAMDALGISRASLLGVSMGGMIAQHFALCFPERVEKLVLAVTVARPGPEVEACIGQWMELARKGDHTALMDSNLRLIYSDAYYRRNQYLIPIVGRLTKPRSYDRFLIQAKACLTHDTWDSLPGIQCPTLVIGGGEDRVVGAQAAVELAERIPGAELKIYPQWGHGVYEEEPDFNRTVLAFLA